MVSVGAGPPEGVVSVKSVPQLLPSPAVPPGELMQAEIASPSV